MYTDRSGIVEFVRENEIGILTINNPPKNRLPDPVIAEPEDLTRWLSADDLKGAIMTGFGNNFSEGADLTSMAALRDDMPEMRRRLDRGKEVLEILRDSPVPIVAAINGACFGGGLEIALACHIRVVGESAMLGFPEADLELLPGLGGTVSCVEEVGMRHALPFLLSSESVSGAGALEMGLAHYVVPRRMVLDKAAEVLRGIIRDKKPEVIHRIMKAIRNGRKMDRTAALREESRYFCELVMSRSKDAELSLPRV